MEPEDLPDLPDLPDLEELTRDDDIGRPDPEPLVPAVDPIEPQVPDDPGSFDLDGLSDLPDLSGVDDWAPEVDTPDPIAPDPVDPVDPVDLGGGPLGPAGEVRHAAPIELEMDGGFPDTPPDPQPTDPLTSPEVDLSLDPLVVDPEQVVDDPGVQGDEIELDDAPELSFDASPSDPFELAADNAWLAPGLIAAGIAAIGLSLPTLARLRRSAPADFAARLDELGIDARVEHLDLTGLEELLADGRTVLLSTDGSAGMDAEAVVELRAVDRERDRLDVADAGGDTFAIDLERFDLAWADSANQVVVASGESGSVALVPVTLGRRDLVAAR